MTNPQQPGYVAIAVIAGELTMIARELPITPRSATPPSEPAPALIPASKSVRSRSGQTRHHHRHRGHPPVDHDLPELEPRRDLAGDRSGDHLIEPRPRDRGIGAIVSPLGGFASGEVWLNAHSSAAAV